jgi:deoxyribose-phosphate aldolase
MSVAKLVADWKTVARTMDHSQLKTDASREAIARLCTEAREYGCAAVCVQPCHVALAHELLAGSGVKTTSVIGFPQGTTLGTVKSFEAAEVLRLGAQELDMVINVAALKAGDRDYVGEEIRALAEIAHKGGALLKVIIEACLLTRAEKILACELVMAAGADFVKTSTGMASGGATVEDVSLMRSIVGDKLGIKAAGGIRTGADAVAILNAGATRLGTSGSVQILQELGAPAFVSRPPSPAPR